MPDINSQFETMVDPALALPSSSSSSPVVHNNAGPTNNVYMEANRLG